MTSASPSATSVAPTESGIRRLLRATEVDTRMIGMIGALALIWIGFNIITWAQNGEGLFLSPRNLWNLSVQTSSIAVMATGMVLVIVMRHIDLSVGSIIGFVSTIIGVAQVHILPAYLGLDNPAIWRSARRSAPFKARWSPTSAFRPSSSRSAGNCSGAAPRGG
jgi:D-xylose transport system permease protein